MIISLILYYFYLYLDNKCYLILFLFLDTAKFSLFIKNKNIKMLLTIMFMLTSCINNTINSVLFLLKYNLKSK